MLLINKYLSEFHFNEIHKIKVNAKIGDCYQTSMILDLNKSGIISFLFRLRGLPFKRTRLNEITEDMRFTLLEENKPIEFLYSFWFKRRTEWITENEIFLKNTNAFYNAKVGWSFVFIQTPNGATEIITETRIFCLNKKTKLIFRIYWFFIKPFSGWIRLEMLRLIKNEVESKC